MKQIISIRNKLVAAMMVLGLVSAPVVLVPAAANAAPNCSGASCVTNGAGNVQTGATSVETVIKNITNVLLFLIGAVSVIMLVIGGFKYVVSNGNADQIKSAKNTILYAVIGLVVAIVAFAIVDWVVDALV